MYNAKKITKAMILAAGEGSRLGPLTSEIPKPLLPVGDEPIIVHQLKWLRYHGVAEVAINLHHFG
jgi:NDP-sugar pyrophosphorylase family protein